nr:hypothetical protein [Tanacetum cinerariifolium]
EPIENQSLPVDASPTALSLGYVVNSDPEEDEKDHKEDLAYYPADRGDNDDDESSNDDDDDDDVEKDEEVKEEEEEHLALADPSDETMTTVNQEMSVEEIERVAYVGSLPLCNQCKFHHNGPCTVKCGNYKKVGHIIQNCKTPATAKNQRTHTCYECGSLRHYKSKCPIVKFYKRVDMIHGRVRASKPKTMQETLEIATKVMNKKISTLVKCQTENKKRLDDTSKNNQNQQQPNKRQNIGRAYTARHGEKKHYGGSKPLCSKCYYHHDGPCAPKCHQCNRFGHLARDWSSINANTSIIQKGTGASQKATCYECGNQGHYRRDCPEQKNQNHENQIKSTKARGVVHAFGGGETEQDLNNIEDEIEA